MSSLRLRQHGPVTEIILDPRLFGRTVFPFRAYLVDGLLIDTGPPRQARLFQALLREMRVEQAVNTHHHEDHAGNNDLLNAAGIRPWAHSEAVALLAALPPIQLYRKLTWGVAASSATRPLGEWLETPRYRFRVVHTPGHSLDHVVLHEPEQGWLFGGDLYIADKLKLLRREEDPHELMLSLERALGLAFDTIFCAHRGRVEGGRAALARKHAYMGELRDRARDLHRAGQPPGEIARRLLGERDFVEWISRGDFTRVNLVEAFLPGWPGPRP